jgi:hypothetical protein
MRNRPRRRKPVAPKPNVSISIEQLESRHYPNDMLTLLATALGGGTLAFLNPGPARGRARGEPRDGYAAPTVSRATVDATRLIS